jgi:spore coat polysaccharide biosynthesis protein SpsF
MPHKIILAMPDYDQKEFREKFNKGEFEGAIDDRFCVYFGSPDDLVERYYGAARKFGIDLVVRVTADCPFGGMMVDEMLIEYLKKGYNGFMGNNALVSSNPFPDGVDAEVFKFHMLVETKQLTNDPVHREHVTPFMYRRGTQYQIHQFLNQRPNSMIVTKHKSFSFDTKEDKQLLDKIVKIYDDLEIQNNGLTRQEMLNKALDAVE